MIHGLYRYYYYFILTSIIGYKLHLIIIPCGAIGLRDGDKESHQWNVPET